MGFSLSLSREPTSEKLLPPRKLFRFSRRKKKENLRDQGIIVGGGGGTGGSEPPAPGIFFSCFPNILQSLPAPFRSGFLLFVPLMLFIMKCCEIVLNFSQFPPPWKSCDPPSLLPLPAPFLGDSRLLSPPTLFSRKKVKTYKKTQYQFPAFSSALHSETLQRSYAVWQYIEPNEMYKIYFLWAIKGNLTVTVYQGLSETWPLFASAVADTRGACIRYFFRKINQHRTPRVTFDLQPRSSQSSHW